MSTIKEDIAQMKVKIDYMHDIMEDFLKLKSDVTKNNICRYICTFVGAGVLTVIIKGFFSS